ncbi:hypothetical protein LN042_33065 [Kitasatospora sp. RB6PN24]|uniref:hypothetical protein n=1 Tax=Kitasatospora humi TaxID=2893891 RepID=UPI001E4ACE86|nr:hypothetical protein [Kitasatospora humi]MCC9311839.1 hypothetical protein [Kitasatospora humi]
MTEQQHDGTGAVPVPGGPEPGPDSGEEQAVRALLHRAVAEVQPSPDALARIRRAVPARRARYRQAWTGAAVIVALTAVAVPTLNRLGALQLSDGSAAGTAAPSGTEAARPAGAVHRTSGPTVPVPVPGDGTPSTSGAGASPTTVGQSAKPSSSASGSPAPAGAGAAPSTAPACARGDLGGGTVTTGQADPGGRVYGAFTVTNISGHPCLLGDPGTIGALVSGGGAVRVVPHTAGDPAPDLPAPAPDSPLLLAAGANYRMVFAWVPDTPCPSTGPDPQTTGSGQPSAAGASASAAAASPGAVSGAGAQAGGARDAVASPGSGSDGGGTAGPTGQSVPPASASASTQPSPAVTPGSLTLTYRPLGAAPDVASATVGGVCGGGTVYRAAVQ